MSLLFCDSFDHYGISDILLKWDQHFFTGGSGIPTSLATGRLGGYGWRCYNSSNGGDDREGLLYNKVGNKTTLIAGTAFRMGGGSSPSGDCTIFRFLDGTATQASLRLRSDGKLAAYRGWGSTLIGTSAASLTSAVWAFIEMKVVFGSGTAGSVIVRLNGSEVINVSGISTIVTSNAYANSFGIGGNRQNVGENGDNRAGYELIWDDVYLCDTSGSYNNDFLGDVRVSVILPTANGTHYDFTPSANLNFNNVDDPVAVTNDGAQGADYNYSKTLNAMDTFQMADMPQSAGLVKGVQTLILARKDDAGPRSIATVQRSGPGDAPVETVEAASPLSTEYFYTRNVRDANPATGVPYTLSDVNALEVGYKVVL